MLTIRFLRTGKKNQPFFRIVVTEKNNPPTAGRFTEIVGFYNPLTKERNLKTDRIKYWISVGAKPSDTVHNLLVAEKVIEGKKIALNKAKKEKTEAASEPPVEKAPKKEKSEEVKPKEEKKTETKAEERKEELAPIKEEKPQVEEKKAKEKLEEKKPSVVLPLKRDGTLEGKEEPAPVEAEKPEEKTEE